MTIIIGSIAVLLFLSAFFSGSETALTATSRPLMHQLERNGTVRALVVNKLLERKGRLLGGILIGNNLVNILASALATSLLFSLFGDAGIAYATLIMTALIVLFSEVLPKTYALHNADRMALWIAPVLRPVIALLSPFSAIAQTLARATLRLFGLRLTAEESFFSATDELRGAIELHHGSQEAQETARAMLHSVLDLTEVEVGEIMIHRKTVARINADDATADIIEQVLDSPYTRLPLWRDDPDNIIGVLHTKELLRALAKSSDDDDADTDINIEALAGDPWFVPETTRLLDQLHAFRERHEHFALVVDEYGSLMGVVTLEDILEEIVGEIADEHDVSVPGLRRQPNGSYIVDGNFTIRDLNRELEWDLPDEEAATVAGLVLHESRRIPDVGQTFLFYGFRFEIMRRQRHQITTVRITPPV